MTPAAEIARLRQGLYRFFGGALCAPDEVRVAELTAAADYLAAIDLADYAFYREWSVLTGVFASGVTPAELAPEHVRLFESGTRGVLCPPIESFYRADGRHEAIADVVAAIQRDYRDLGVATLAAADAPDHVVVQLEIMSTLCSRESAAWAAGLVTESEQILDAEATFARRHLSWLPEFRARVHAAAPHPYYAALLDAVHSFVVHDSDLIAGLRRWSGAPT